MLEKAKRFPYEKLICQNIENKLKVKNNYFDIVVLTGVMEFIKKPFLLFKEVNKKLKKQGLFLLTVPKKSNLSIALKRKSYFRKDIEPFFIKAGFRILKTKIIFGYFKKINNRKKKSFYYCYVLKKI